MKIENMIFEDGRIAAINELILEPLPVSESYKLMKFAKELKEKEDVYRGAKISIFKKYGKELKDGSMEIKKGNEEKARKELDELLAVEEEYSLDKKIKLPSDISLSAQQLLLLEEIVEIE